MRKKAGDYEYGNRIIAPEKDLNNLLSKGAETPIILQILNKNNPEKVSHCSVIEWTAPENTIYVPSWMMFDFALQVAAKDAPKLTLRYYERPFLKGSFIQIQPYQLASVQSEEFKDVQKLFELSLKKYQCLTIGDTLRVQHEKKVHFFEVTDVLSAQSIAGVTPFDVVSLINTDVSVDFLPPKDAPAIQERKEQGLYDREQAPYETVGVDPKSIPNPDGIIKTTKSGTEYADQKAIDEYTSGNNNTIATPNVDPIQEQKSTGQNTMSDNTEKNKELSWVKDVNGEKMICDDSKPNTKIQIMPIGGKKETLQVNLSSTIKQLYAHFKAVSTHDGGFQLLAGFPPKPLKDPSATIESAGVKGARIQQKKL
mmetsp:Transcript_64265/g.57780  ORF Transcript_64265/g.57780 Transcript_64265/m.57780 type:complete len:368 (-) Transcript_64265:21-1124(-)